MPRMIPDPAFPLDQIRNARRGPQARLISEHFGTSFQFLGDTPQLTGAEPRLAPGTPGSLQSGPAFLLYPFGPPMHRLSVHAQRTRYFCLTLSLLEHAGGPQTPRLQRNKISLHAAWVAHELNLHQPLLHILYIMRDAIKWGSSVRSECAVLQEQSSKVLRIVLRVPLLAMMHSCYDPAFGRC